MKAEQASRSIKRPSIAELSVICLNCWSALDSTGDTGEFQTARESPSGTSESIRMLAAPGGPNGCL